jgi:nicotinate-nucleotide adenylyltransferase
MDIKTKIPKRVGVYSGTFDPVHAGHLSFALQAIEAAQLDVLYFLPERRPRSKVGTEHFGHRVAMLKRAVKPHNKLRVMELEDVSFSVAQTLPRLQKRFPKSQLVFLVGSDVVQSMASWPNVTQLHKQVELVVGLREADDPAKVTAITATWKVQPRAMVTVMSYAPTVSSRRIREGLRRREYVPGLLQSVLRYSERNWLYVSLA